MAEGVHPHADVARARTILLELERLYNHLHDVSAVCAGVGFAAGSMQFAALKELAQRLNRSVTGHRFLFGSVRPWQSAVAVGRDDIGHLRQKLTDLRSQCQRAWRQMLFNGSVQDRLTGIGMLSGDAARRLGTVGPALRATGVHHDVRTHSPRLRYEGFTPAVPEQPTGDVAARVEMRAVELNASFGLLDTLLAEGPVRPASLRPSGDGRGLGVAGVESPRGETWCVVELAEGRVSRVHLRTGSYANWPSVAHAATESLLADFPLINKSFELCYACVDR
jgi:Ni,Fe-hydrogenase III large subunit